MTGIISAIFVSFSILIQISAQDAPIVEAFVKSGAADGDGKTFDAPIGSLNDAYDLLTDESEGELTIKVIKANDENNALEAEAITFNKTSGITIEGITEAEGTNEKAEIDCAITAENDLFKCEKTVTFKNLIFDFTTKQEDEGELIANADGLALIHADAESTSLTISNCEFKETTPENTCGMLSNAGEEVKFHLVKVSAGSLTIDTVECTSESELKFSATPFLIDGATTAVTAVSLTSLKLSNITSSSSAVVKIVGKTDAAISVKVDGCTFTECSSSDETATSGALYVESENAGSSFEIGDTGATTFTKCTCENGKSGGIYLKMTEIGDASKLSWPTTGTNLAFTECTAEETDPTSNAEKNTGLYLEVKTELHENIADEMKKSFAAGYTLNDYRWFVAAKGESDADVDFTLKYFDRPTEVFVKSGGKGEGVRKEAPIGSLKGAYELLAETSDQGFSIKVIKAETETTALKPDAMTLDKTSGITIEGITNEDGTNGKVEIDCAKVSESDLFKCKKTVELKYLIFKFQATSGQDANQLKANSDTFALIHAVAGTESEEESGSENEAESGSESLTISNCDFVRPETGDIGIHLVKVNAGSLTMTGVKCEGGETENSFTATPFLVDGTASKVSLTSLTLSKITSTVSPVMKITSSSQIEVILDKCTFTECSSSSSEAATSGALYVKSEHAGSTFSVEDNGKTKFDGCTCAKGKSGAIFLEMTAIKEATQLSWPEKGDNLELTGCKVSEEDTISNTEKNTALYLNVPVKIHRDIAKEMKKSFAANYKKDANKCFVIAKVTDDSSEVDFTEVYFDPITNVYVSEGATSDDQGGLSYDNPKKSLKAAYDLLGEGVGEENFKVNIIKTDKAYKAEDITFDKLSLITIVGVQKTDEANGEAEVNETEVAIDCDVKTGGDFFTCKKKVEFRSLAFNFPSTLEGEQAKNDGPEVTGPFALIITDGEDAELSIVKCRFVRPTRTDKLGMLSNADEETVGIHLVKVSAGSLTMNQVECTLENEVKFSVTPFLIEGAATVSLTSLNLKKIATNSSAVMKITSTNKIEVSLDKCTFTDCVSSSLKTATSGALYVESASADSTFEIGDTGTTTFTKCTCENGKSGGIYLKMTEIDDASKLKWPETGTNLEFTGCTTGEADPTSNAEKNTGLYLEVKTELHKNIADAMKKSFATGYTLENNRWFVAAKRESDADVDFTLKYFDQPTEVFVKSGGKGEGVRKEAPIGSLKGAYELLAETSDQGFSIKVIKAETETTALKPEAITFDKSKITIEGITEAKGANEKAEIDCAITDENDLFTCEKTVAFKNLIFDFSTTITQDEGELKANEVGLALIHADAESTSLSILNCDFVRPTTGDIVGIHLVKVSAGSLKMTGAKCIDDEKTVSFKVIPFLVEGAKEVVIEDVEVKKVEVEEGAAMSIKNGIKGEGKENKKNEGAEETKGTIVVVEGLRMEGVKSKSGKTAGVEIALGEENSKVRMGRTKVCTFKECKAENGKSGAIYIEMKHVSGNLELPGENKLEIDGTNSGKGTSGASLCIVAADFDSFSKQDNAFEFAKNYDEGETGWVVGAADENAEPEDVYEKYLKEKKDPEPEPEPGKKDDRKTNAGVVAVAVVVPIVFVIAVVVIVIVVVKKRRSKYNSDDVGKDKEQEMSNNV